MSGAFSIAGRPIGPGHPPYVIAELSGNHNGQIERALRLIDVAKEMGADAVKLQTYTADTMTIDAAGPEFEIKGGLWDGRRLHELYQEAQTPWDWHPQLFDHARRVGIACFSTPFDASAVDLLEKLDAPAYKVASFEIVDLPLIRRVAQTGKPLIISTGMANLGEIGEAVQAARSAGASQIALLHCTSGYPTPPEDSNLATISHLATAFGTVTGLSDHTPGHAVAVAAVALGASIIEKHVTLRRADGGPDGAFSLEPAELRALVDGCRVAFAAIGHVRYDLAPSEKANIIFRRSLYAVADIAEGEVFNAQNVRAIRPGYGLPPKMLPDVIGRRATTAIPRGTALKTVHIGG